MQRVPSRDIQPRFKLYMIAMGLNPGDEFKGYEYINWISVHSAAYKKTIGKSYTDTINPANQAEFTEYISARVFDNMSEEEAS